LGLQRVKDTLPTKKAATFFQLDERISMMIDLEFASQLPAFCCTGHMDSPRSRYCRGGRTLLKDSESRPLFCRRIEVGVEAMGLGELSLS
jgi:hypothetical protein